MPESNLSDILAAAKEKAENGQWVVGNGGTETPVTDRLGRRLLWCWQPSTGRHAYLDLGTDMILDDADAFGALGAY